MVIGTMIEVPRGAFTADEIAQTSLGMSRDDSVSFIPANSESALCQSE